MPIDKPALAGRLAAYLAERAWHEGEPMGLTPADFEDALDQGIGSAFGIHWNTEGELTRDDQEPEPGFLSAWIARQRGIDGVDAPRRHRCAKVAVLAGPNGTRGSVA